MDAGQQLEPSQIAEWHTQYERDIRSFLTGVLRNSDLANEALQATFVKLTEVGHTAQPATIKGWLFRVAYNEAMLLKRREEVDTRVTRKAAWKVVEESKPVDAQMELGETISRVRAELDLLPEELRSIVRLRIYDERTFAEIAQQLGLPLGTVVTRMRAALQRLSRGLEGLSDLM